MFGPLPVLPMASLRLPFSGFLDGAIGTALRLAGFRYGYVQCWLFTGPWIRGLHMSVHFLPGVVSSMAWGLAELRSCSWGMEPEASHVSLMSYSHCACLLGHTSGWLVMKGLALLVPQL